MQGYALSNVDDRKKARKEAKALKSEKIIKILSEHTTLPGKKVLEVGTGSGYIASEIAKRVGELVSVDIVDDREVRDGYKQVIVPDESLPFKDGEFDIVITNHVVEHVFNQPRHLSEIRRVLKSDGIVYLATPNKWWITDPHYNLPFISWLPRKAAGVYLKYTKGRKWDVYTLSLKSLHNLSSAAGLELQDMSMDIIVQPQKYKIKSPAIVSSLLGALPDRVRGLFLHAVPTHVKIARPMRERQDAEGNIDESY